MGKLRKGERQSQLRDRWRLTPFASDEDMAQLFGVSVQTIRLDRIAMGIPELRERLKEAAQEHVQEVHEGVLDAGAGDILDVQRGVSGLSLLVTDDSMTDKDGLVTSPFLYAQADALARAVIGGRSHVAGIGNIKYKQPVSAGRRLVAKAEVVRKRGDKAFVWVIIRDRDTVVYRAKFIMEPAMVTEAGSHISQS